MPTPEYNYYLNNNQDNDWIVDVIEISHSKLSKVFYFCNEPNGHTVTLENSDVVFAEGVNFEYKRNSSKDDTDERYQLTFDDANGELQAESELIPLDDEEDIKITCRDYMFSDLTTINNGVVVLDAISLTFDVGKATIEAQAPSLADNRTGELLTYERFPTQT